MTTAVTFSDRTGPQVEGLDDFTTPSETRTRRSPRHPAAVTAERVSEHIAAYSDHLTPREIGILDKALATLAELPDRIRAAGGDPS